MQSWKQWVRKLKQEIYVLYLASIHPQVPWYVRFLAAIIAAYAFSPIDLIPDIIPVIGYLDDLILLPLGIWCVLKLIPPEVLMECREKAAEKMAQGKPQNWGAACVIISIWFLMGVLAFVYLSKVFR